MTTNTERLERIAALAPRQALDIVQYITAWLDTQRTAQPYFTTEQQVEILNALFQQAGYTPLPLSPAAKPGEQAGGQAARQLLTLLTASGDDTLLAELDHWLTNPPETETRALVELVVVPIVLTACIMALGTSFAVERKDGITHVNITRPGLSAKDLKQLLPGFYRALKSLIGLG